MIVCVYNSQSQPVADNHEPNSGFVSDAAAAADIAKVIVISLSPHDKYRGKGTYDAVLKDGIWTVRHLSPQIVSELQPPLIIQIRQKTGAIMKYEDPNA